MTCTEECSTGKTGSEREGYSGEGISLAVFTIRWNRTESRTGYSGRIYICSGKTDRQPIGRWQAHFGSPPRRLRPPRSASRGETRTA